MKLYQGSKLSERGVKEYLETYNIPIHVIVAKDGDKIIGTLMWMRRGYIEVGIADILEVEVSDDYQRKGIGKKLIEKCIQDVKEYFSERNSSADTLTVSTDDDNLQGIKFYEKMGFKKVAHLGPMLRNEILYANDLSD